MLNPYILLALVVAWGASVAGAFFYGQGVGKDSEIATQAREDKVRSIATEAAASAAAHAISQIQVKHTTIRQQATTEIRRDPIYVDCNHPDAVRRLLDAALTNGGAASAPSGGGKLSGADAAR